MTTVKLRRASVVLVVCLVVSMLATDFAFAGYAELSPFEMVRWQDKAPEVKVHGNWYKLVGINKVTTKDILNFARRQYGNRWDKRFCEDLVEILTEMGKPPLAKVDLIVTKLDGGKMIRLLGVPMTEENRNRIRQAKPRVGNKQGGGTAARQVNRIERKHPVKPDPRFTFLTRRYHGDSTGRTMRSRTHAEEDLDQLEWHLKNEYSYLRWRGVDIAAALDTIRAGLGEEIAIAEFHIQLSKAVALFGDGHSRVRGVNRVLPAGFLPCTLADVAGKLVALSEDGDKLFEPGFPNLVAIDGVGIDKWLAAAQELSP